MRRYRLVIGQPRLFASGLLAAVVIMAGCKSGSPSQFVSPRVRGRVLDAVTRQPVSDVQVQRVVPEFEGGRNDQVRGGEVLARPQPLHTSADGTFDLDSEKSVAFFHRIGWSTVRISFERIGYERFITNFTAAQAVNSPQGEPIVQAGDIAVKPKMK